MFRTLAAVVLFTTPFLASAVHVPYTHEMVKRNSRANVPRTLLDRSPDDLVARQATCGVGQDTCTTGGCCDGSCCGDGCCPAGYVCHFVGNTPGCCPTGQTCSDVISGCTDPTLVECTGYDFCCPPGQACSQDALGNAQCGGVTVGSGNGTGSGTGSGNGGVTTAAPGTGATTAVGSGNNNGGGGFTQINTAVVGSAINSAINSFINGGGNGNASPTTTSTSGGGIFHHNAAAGQAVAPLGAMGLVAAIAGAIVL